MEADLIPSLQWLDAGGFQPMAGVELFELLEQRTGFGGWSSDHGSLEDRRLNLLSLMHVADIRGIERESTANTSEFHSELLARCEEYDPLKSTTQIQKFKDRAEFLLEKKLLSAGQIVSEIVENPVPSTWLFASRLTESAFETHDSLVLNTLAVGIEKRLSTIISDENQRALCVLNVIAILGKHKLEDILNNRKGILDANGLPYSVKAQDAIIDDSSSALDALLKPETYQHLGCKEIVVPDLLNNQILSFARFAVSMDIFTGLDSGEFAEDQFASQTYEMSLIAKSAWKFFDFGEFNVGELKDLFVREARKCYGSLPESSLAIFDVEKPREAQLLFQFKLEDLKNGKSAMPSSQLEASYLGVAGDELFRLIADIEFAQTKNSKKQKKTPTSKWEEGSGRITSSDEFCLRMRAIFDDHGHAVFSALDKILKGSDQQKARYILSSVTNCCIDMCSPLDKEIKSRSLEKDFLEQCLPKTKSILIQLWQI